MIYLLIDTPECGCVCHIEDDDVLTPPYRCGSVPNFMCQGMSVSSVVINDTLLFS